MTHFDPERERERERERGGGDDMEGVKRIDRPAGR